MIVSTALLCLSLNIYHEARSEPVAGQVAVAMVTLNRAKHRKDKVCSEVFRPYQFSWANGRVQRIAAGWELEVSLKPREREAWSQALRIARKALTTCRPDITKGSTYYHTHAVKPAWRKAFKHTVDIGAHRFYRDPGRQSVVTASL